MPPTTTRTLNPLPFEHLEPKRFEDLARQLAHGFKPWRRLEATGRTGADEGFDARGFEIVAGPPSPVTREDGDEGMIDDGSTDRLWLIQCKRERRIGPAQIKAHLAGITEVARKDLFGIVFVAACDFSLTTRDVLRRWCSEHGISEWHIWGKAELEDLLFQPANDSLLFAYFGISLQIRRRSTATNIRRTTTLKRKLKRLLEDQHHWRGTPVIIRDIFDTTYPSFDGEDLETSDKLWRIKYAKELGIRGVSLLTREHYAFYDRETGEWDIASKENLAKVSHHEGNAWDPSSDNQQVDVAHEFWISIHEAQRFTAKFDYELPYEEILEIDEVGDACSKLPTLYVEFQRGRLPLGPHGNLVLEPAKAFASPVSIRKEDHRRVFPPETRDTVWESEWAGRNGFSVATEPLTIDLSPPAWLTELRQQRDGTPSAEEP